MKVKKEYLILLLVIVALTAYLLLRNTDQSRLELPQPTKLDAAAITRLVITHGDNKLELEKKDDQWVVEPQGYDADNAEVKKMVKAVADLRLTALVSESGSYQRYQLSDADKINVQAFDGSTRVRNLDVGQVAPTLQHTFVKLADDPNVYHARGTFKNDFDQTVESIRDKTVLKFAKADITAIEIQKGDASMSLTKAEIQPETKDIQAKDIQEEKKEGGGKPDAAIVTKTQWQAADGRVVDQTAVDNLLPPLADQKCESYINDKTKADFTDPLWTLTFSAGDKTKTYSLSVFNKAKEDDLGFPAVSSASAYVFTLSDNRVKSIEQQMDTLLHPEKKNEAAAKKPSKP